MKSNIKNMYNRWFRYIVIVIFTVISVVVNAQENMTTTDSVISSLQIDQLRINPADFNSPLDILVRDWYISNSFEIECSKNKYSNDTLTDELCRTRLEKISLGFTMPYNDIVRQYINNYLRHPRQIEYMLGLGETYYYPMFEEALERYQMPLELKYLPVIESALNAKATSHAGAAGLWQFMITTGRSYGLEVNSLVDERRDPLKSSEAAAHYLHDLYIIYDDWLLAIAAYNCGPGNVAKAIRCSGGKKDYWAIYPYLPKETRGYVPIFIAANYVMNYYSEHGMCPARPTFNTTVDTININKRIHFQQIADVLQVPIEELRFLNPQYRRDIIPGNIKPSAVVLPMNLINAFTENLDTIAAYNSELLVAQNMNSSPKGVSSSTSSTRSSSSSNGHVIYYKVRSGDTLGKIAAKYHTTVSNIKKWNRLSSNMIRVNQSLKIYK